MEVLNGLLAYTPAEGIVQVIKKIVTLFAAALLIVGLKHPAAADAFLLPSDLQHALGDYDSGRFEKAIVVIRKYAREDHPVALFLMADAHNNGNGVGIDFEAALALYERSAQKDFAPAAQKLGFIYAFQYSIYKVEGDDRKAAGYFESAANNGYVSSQHTLGVLSFWGAVGYERNEAVALRWLNLAAGQGFESSLKLLKAIEFSKQQRETLVQEAEDFIAENEPTPVLDGSTQQECIDFIKLWTLRNSDWELALVILADDANHFLVKLQGLPGSENEVTKFYWECRGGNLSEYSFHNK